MEEELRQTTTGRHAHGKPSWCDSGCACRRLLHSAQPPAVAAAALDLLEAALPCTVCRTGAGPLRRGRDTWHSLLDGGPWEAPDAAACARALLGRMLAGLSRGAVRAEGSGPGSGSESGYRGWAASGAGLRLRLRAAALLARLAARSWEAFVEVRRPAVPDHQTCAHSAWDVKLAWQKRSLRNLRALMLQYPPVRNLPGPPPHAGFAVHFELRMLCPANICLQATEVLVGAGMMLATCSTLGGNTPRARLAAPALQARPASFADAQTWKGLREAASSVSEQRLLPGRRGFISNVHSAALWLPSGTPGPGMSSAFSLTARSIQSAFKRLRQICQEKNMVSKVWVSCLSSCLWVSTVSQF